MNLAKEFGVDVDLHLHDAGSLGLYTMEHWLRMVEDRVLINKGNVYQPMN